MSWQDEREMTPRQYKNAIDRLGMTQAASGRFLGRSERSIHRYVADEAKVRVAEAMLLRFMIEHNITPKVPPKSGRS